MSTAVQLTTLGLFGGTFDPIHNGHLRLALELKQTLGLTAMRLLPCHLPPHREQPGRGSEERATMVRLAVQHCPELTVDERELQREGPSYTLDTLAQLRQELGPQVSLCWCVGMDSLVSLERWHRWRELLNFAHLVVVARPGWSPPTEGELADWLQQHRVESAQLHARPAGGVVLVNLRLLDIAATDIRQCIAAGHSPQFLLPDAVCHYIEDRGLYRAPAD